MVFTAGRINGRFEYSSLCTAHPRFWATWYSLDGLSIFSHVVIVVNFSLLSFGDRVMLDRPYSLDSLRMVS